MDKFKGLFSALLTPFNEDGSINFDSLENLLNSTFKTELTAFMLVEARARVCCFHPKKECRFLPA